MVSSSLLTPDAPSAAAATISRESLGAYIDAEIARCSGPQLPCFHAEQIIDGFWERFGADGMVICRQAFEAHNGMWHGAPVTVQRFQAHHDQFFAVPLLAEAQGGSRG